MMFDSLAVVPLGNAKKIEQEVNKNKTRDLWHGMAWHGIYEVFPWPRGSSATPIGIHYSKAKKIVLLMLETTNLLQVLNHLTVIVVTYLL
jgi:hypothetical protein